MNKKELQNSFSNLEPYNTEQEKNALIKSLDAGCKYTDISKILGYNSSNEVEAEAYIYKLREISVGDLIETTYSCKCNHQDVYYMSIPKMFFISKTDNYSLLENFEDTDDENINNKSLDSYNEEESTIEINNLKIFNPVLTFTCRKCNEEFKLKSEVFDIISKYGIKNIFEQYVDISIYTNMTKKDTDSMIPYEREIFLGLIQLKEDEKG